MSDRDHQDNDHRIAADAAQADNGGTSDNYKIGYRRPPLDRRFKPGCSGNPRGRPKGSRNARTVVEQVIKETVPVRENGRVRKITKLEAMIQAAVLKAMKGDSRSLNSILAFMAKTNQFAEAEAETSAALPEDDAAILADFLRRQSGGAGPDGANTPENQ
jgi:hypothetical protein